MKLVTAINSNKFAFAKFAKWLQDNKHDYVKILQSDNHLEVLVYYISFLESEQVYIVTDHNGYAVYKQFDKYNQLVIACEFIDKLVSSKLVLGIISAFNYLENPF